MSRPRKTPPPRHSKPGENPVVDEISRLRHCLRDLVALSGLSAAWQGGAPRQIAEHLAEVLQHTLALEFIYVRLQAHHETASLEAACTARNSATPEQTQRIARALAPWLAAQPPGHSAVTVLADPLGPGTVRVALLPIGHDGAFGLLMAAARHAEFPTDAECALLQMGLNQAALVLQQQRADEALRQREEHYRVLTEAIPHLTWTMRPDQTLAFANRAWLDATGLTIEDVNREGWATLIHPDDQPRLRQETALPLARSEAHSVEFRLRHRDGQYRWVLARIAPLKDSHEGVVQWIGTTTDIHDRKLAEETTARLAAIIESSDDAIISKSLEGVIATWNKSAEQLFGYAAAEAIGQPITLIIPPDRQAEEQAILRRLRCGERLEHFETVRRAKSGRLLDVSITVSPIRNARGQIIGASKIARDISERKRTEEQLRQSEARFRLLTETVPSMVWTAAPDGTITYANQRWLQYVGLTLEQNAQNWPEKVLHPDDYQRCLTEWRRALEQGTEYEIEVRNRRYDGVYRWFITRAVPLKDSAGRISAWVGATTDIHEQKELQGALQEASRQKDEFLAMLGHELRNPLGPMRNAVEILNRVGAQSEEACQARAMIDRQLGHMARLVDDLLDISRIARGKILLRTQRLDFVRLVRQTAEDYRSILEATGIRLELDLPSEALWVDGDSTRLAQIVGNLLHNAHKFTNPGGRVVVRVHADGDQATVSVRDTGIGIDSEMLGWLFKIFSQAKQGLSRSRGGLGLGLALVKGFAELHGGGVKAASEGPGQGAQFTICLPLRTAPVVASPVPPQPEGGLGDRVLVIEDNRDAADSLAMLLNLTGYQVRTAYTGEAGLSTAREFQPQAVICDIGLPDIDGYEVARRLRADPVLGKVPLVALTGYGRDEDQRQTFEAGFDLHLTKPVDLATLRQAVVKLKALASRAPAGSQYC